MVGWETGDANKARGMALAHERKQAMMVRLR